MSSLKTLEKEGFEELLGMSGGYVLDFSNQSFAAFFRETASIPIYDAKYAGYGDSKAKRLRAFWESESDPLVGKALAELMEIWAYKTPQPSATDARRAEYCRATIGRLLGRPVKPNEWDRFVVDVKRSSSERWQERQGKLPAQWIASIPGEGALVRVQNDPAGKGIEVLSPNLDLLGTLPGHTLWTRGKYFCQVTDDGDHVELRQPENQSHHSQSTTTRIPARLNVSKSLLMWSLLAFGLLLYFRQGALIVQLLQVALAGLGAIAIKFTLREVVSWVVFLVIPIRPQDVNCSRVDRVQTSMISSRT